MCFIDGKRTDTDMPEKVSKSFFFGNVSNSLELLTSFNKEVSATLIFARTENYLVLSTLEFLYLRTDLK